MNKNTLIGSILMALIVFGWMYMNKPNEEAMAKAKAKKAAALVQDSVAAAKPAGNLVLPSNAAPEAKAAPVLSAVAAAEPAAVDSAVADSAAFSGSGGTAVGSAGFAGSPTGLTVQAYAPWIERFLSNL